MSSRAVNSPSRRIKKYTVRVYVIPSLHKNMKNMIGNGYQRKEPVGVLFVSSKPTPHGFVGQTYHVPVYIKLHTYMVFFLLLQGSPLWISVHMTTTTTTCTRGGSKPYPRGQGQETNWEEEKGRWICPLPARNNVPNRVEQHQPNYTYFPSLYYISYFPPKCQEPCYLEGWNAVDDNKLNSRGWPSYTKAWWSNSLSSITFVSPQTEVSNDPANNTILLSYHFIAKKPCVQL